MKIIEKLNSWLGISRDTLFIIITILFATWSINDGLNRLADTNDFLDTINANIANLSTDIEDLGSKIDDSNMKLDSINSAQ